MEARNEIGIWDHSQVTHFGSTRQKLHKREVVEWEFCFYQHLETKVDEYLSSREFMQDGHLQVLSLNNVYILIIAGSSIDWWVRIRMKERFCRMHLLMITTSHVNATYVTWQRETLLDMVMNSWEWRKVTKISSIWSPHTESNYHKHVINIRRRGLIRSSVPTLLGCRMGHC